MNLLMGRSLAGHDKHQVYVVIREEDDYLYLVNGTTKTVASPKKKNRKHIQLIRNIPPEVADVAREENDYRDLWVKRVVRIYTDLTAHNS